MHYEELKHKQIGTLKGILLVVAIVFGLLFLIEVVNFLQYWLQVYWIQFFLYGGLVVAAYFAVKYWMTEYLYLIEKDRITFGRRLGKREKELLSVPRRDIKACGEYADMLEKVAGKKKYRFTFRKKKTAFVLDCANCAIFLSPTQEYKDKIREIIRARSSK